MVTGLGAVTGVAASTVAAGAASITIGEVTVSCLVARGVTLAIGDVVLVHRQGSARWVTSVLYAAAPPPPPDVNDPPPIPKPVVVTGTLVVAAVETRSYRSGKWRTDTDDLVQGVTPGQGNSTGCAFYGNKPRSLAGATVTKATIRVQRIRAGDFAARTSTLRLMTQKTRPSGAPTLTSSTSGPSLAVGKTDTAFTIPTSWAQAMVDGTSGGLAVFDGSGDPYIRYSGRSTYGPTFTLTIRWTR